MLQDASQPAERLRHGWWPVQLEGYTSYAPLLKMFAPLGCGTGGSSSLYAAQMERLMPSDFERSSTTHTPVTPRCPRPGRTVMPSSRPIIGMQRRFTRSAVRLTH
jgi:hypothetical protein